MRAILLLLIGLIQTAPTFAAETGTFSKRISAEPSGRVKISNVSGSVAITAWDRPEIDVQARLGSGVERVDVIQENGGGVIKVILRQNSDRDGNAALEVRIPADSQLEVSTVSASIVVESVRGKIRLQSVSGEVRTDVAGADMEVKTVSGSIVLRGSGQLADMRVSTVSGSISLTRGAGEFEASTTNGEVNAALEPARSVRMRSTSGNLKFSGRLLRDANMEAETVSGSIAIQATSESGYEYDVSAFSGSIRNCFGKDAVRTSQYAPGSRLNGKHGDGNASVRLKTLSGSIDLCDR